MVLKYHRSV